MLRRIINKFLFAYERLLSAIYGTQCTVYMIHSVGGGDLPKGSLDISMDRFMEFVNSISGDKAMRLEEWEEHTGCWAITFDDAWESFYRNAYPVLRSRNIPFTIFVSVELLDRPFYLSTQQLKELSQCPLCTIGSHGVHHCYFSRMSKSEVEREFEVSRRVIEGIIKREVTLFAFPYGSYAACGLRNKSLALKYYKYAFSTIPTGIIKKHQKKYFLPRINVN